MIRAHNLYNLNPFKFIQTLMTRTWSVLVMLHIPQRGCVLWFHPVLCSLDAYQYGWLIMCKFSISLLIFCQIVLSIIDNHVLTPQLLLLSYPFQLKFCQFLFHLFWESIMRCIYVLIVTFSLMD